MSKAYRTYWYDYLDINNLLYAKSNAGTIYGFTQASSKDPIQLKQIIDEGLAMMGEFSLQSVVIPINLGYSRDGVYKGPHWVGIAIRKSESDELMVFYNDPGISYIEESEKGFRSYHEYSSMDESLPDLRGILKDIGIQFYNIIDFQTRQQNYSYDCGPWTVLNLHSFATTGTLPVATAHNILIQRREFFGYIHIEQVLEDTFDLTDQEVVSTDAVNCLLSRDIYAQTGLTERDLDLITFNYEKRREVPELSLENVLSLMQECVPYKKEFLAPLAGKIIDSYEAFASKHAGIDWLALSNFHKALEVLVPFGVASQHKNLGPLVEYALKHETVETELKNLEIAIGYIRTIPFYRQTEPLTQHINELISLVMDGKALYQLGLELSWANLEALDKYWQPAIINEKIPLEVTDTKIKAVIDYARDTGRTHCILVIARLGEAIHALSESSQARFPPEILKTMSEARNIIFHPEKRDNWNKIDYVLGSLNVPNKKSAEFGAQIQDMFSRIDEIKQAYKEASDCYNSLTTIQVVSGAGLVLTQIIELWSGLTKHLVIPELKRTSSEELIKALKKKSIYTSKDFDSDDLQTLEVYFSNKVAKKCSEDSKKLQQTYLKALFHVGLKGHIDSEEEILELLDKSIKHRIFYTATQLKESQDFCAAMLLNNEVENKIGKWVYCKRLGLFEDLRKCTNNIYKQQKSLEENKSEYVDAKSRSGSEVGLSGINEPDILKDYMVLIEKNRKSIQEKKGIIQSILLINEVASEAYKIQRINEVSCILEELVESLEKVDTSDVSICVDGVWRGGCSHHYITIPDYPSRSVLEFRIMVAGSLVRACINNKSNNDMEDPFINAIVREEIEVDGKEITIYEVLKQLQYWRGEASHSSREKAGIMPNPKGSLIWRYQSEDCVYTEYAKTIIPYLNMIYEELQTLITNPKTENLERRFKMLYEDYLLACSNEDCLFSGDHDTRSQEADNDLPPPQETQDSEGNWHTQDRELSGATSAIINDEA